MATDDDDVLTGPVPPPDAEPTAAERAHARTFAELVDKTLAGRTPPAMSADDRALLEVATVIRAASGKAPLAEARRQAVVEDALRQALGGAGTGAGTSTTPLRRRGGRASARVEGGEAGDRGARTGWRALRAISGAPWAIAGGSALVAAAALLALWLRAPAPAAPLPTAWQSRPADALIGPIPQARAGDAEARIDAIFADRLDGYRDDTVYQTGRTP